jgi:thiamine-monophosphate kinase
MNEGEFISSLRTMAHHPAARGLADDCAVLDDLVLTHDMMVAGTHFPHHAAPADVAWKLVAVNLSDLAAKGAKPIGVLLGYMLGDDAWDRAFISGLRDALSHYGTALLGGDTVAAPHASDSARSDGSPAMRAIGLTAIGRASHLPVPSRSGAQAGDALYVTGTLGAALHGFHLDATGASEPADALVAFRRPVPLLAEGIALAQYVSAMMDISDGLLLDASRMAIASAKCLAIDSAAVPLPATLPPELRDQALRWGDDYQLLFTLPPSRPCPVAATRIGTVHAAGPHPLLIDGAPPASGLSLGWQHGV